MGKLMKYEIKGSYKVILGILAIVLLMTTVLYTYIAKKEGSPIIALASMIMFGTFFAAFFYIVGSFRKELYEDRGYLTFSLPLTGNQILGAKLLVALLWFVLLGVVTGFYNLFMTFRMALKETGLTFSEAIDEIKLALSHINFDVKAATFMVLTLLVMGILTLILIYFSMTLSRVTLKNKKIGGMWFIVFLILSVLIGYLHVNIATKFPLYLDLDNWKIITSGMADSYTEFYIHENQGLFFSIEGNGYLSITGNLFSLIVGVVLFLSTGYLIENKIDL